MDFLLVHEPLRELESDLHYQVGFVWEVFFYRFWGRCTVGVHLITRRSVQGVLGVFHFCEQMCFIRLVQLQDPRILNYFLLFHGHFRLNRYLSIEDFRREISSKM